MPLHKIRRAIAKLSLEQLKELDHYIHELIAKLESQEEQPTSTSSRIQVLEEKKVGGKTYRLQKVKCGKPGCKCAKGALHGPYWYAYWWEDGRTKSKYIGKSLPG